MLICQIVFVGYGHTVPLSYEGKVFAILYSLIGVPLAFIMFSAVVSRLMRPLAALLQLLKDKVGTNIPYRKKVFIGIQLWLFPHYKDFHKDFSKKNRWEKRCPYIKLLRKSLQL